MMCKDGNCGKMCGLHMVAKVLLFIGGINWGLIGLGGFAGVGMNEWNLVNKLLGAWPQVEWVVYILVGVSALLMCMVKKCCQKCEGGSCKSGSCKGGSCSGNAAGSCSAK